MMEIEITRLCRHGALAVLCEMAEKTVSEVIAQRTNTVLIGAHSILRGGRLEEVMFLGYQIVSNLMCS